MRCVQPKNHDRKSHAKLHDTYLNRRSPVCTAAWRARKTGFRNTLPHCGHLRIVT